jgi:hypothetical protein
VKTILTICALVLRFFRPVGFRGGTGRVGRADTGRRGIEIKGTVAETMNAASYTYVLVNAGSGKPVWAAAPQFAVKAGDTVVLGGAMPMVNYQSKTLKRTFDVVYFSGSVAVNGSGAAAGAPTAELPAGHPPLKGPGAQAPINLSGINRAAGGQTVAEICTGKEKFVGQPIAVRGRVVKFNANILGKNWLHVRDGSGVDGSNDLTITTAAFAKVGDLVLVTGKLAADRDFGSGYRYGLMVEDAKVTVEP